MNSQNNSPAKKMKLTLKLDTVKNLSTTELAKVVGGAEPNSFRNSCTGSCKLNC